MVLNHLKTIFKVLNYSWSHFESSAKRKINIYLKIILTEWNEI